MHFRLQRDTGKLCYAHSSVYCEPAFILNTRSDNEPVLESETKLEVVASVNIEAGTENSSHATVDLTTALAAACALHVCVRRIT